MNVDQNNAHIDGVDPFVQTSDYENIPETYKVGKCPK